MGPIVIEYRFCLEAQKQVNFSLKIDPNSVKLVDTQSGKRPEWSLLDYYQCPNCPLSPQQETFCPLATNIADIVEKFKEILSYEKVQVEVVTYERTVSREASAQEALSSLMGFMIAVSDCPHTRFFKPMARYHLPFASSDETIYRATSTFLLAQYLLHKEDIQTEFNFNGLKEIYENMRTVNLAIAKRLRAASKADSSVNAIISLDTFAQIMPYIIDEKLEDIHHLFKPYIDSIKAKSS